MTSFIDSLIELLIKGIPESFLFVLAVNVFTRTKFDLKKYLVLGSIFTLITYLTRWLPINLGTHTMLSLLALIFLYLIAYKVDLQYIIKSIISVIAIAIIIVVSELIDLLLLSEIYGKIKAEELLNSSSPLIKSVSALPSILIFGIVVLVIYLIMSKKDKSKVKEHGKTDQKTGK